jgi:hypothetical protein
VFRGTLALGVPRNSGALTHTEPAEPDTDAVGGRGQLTRLYEYPLVGEVAQRRARGSVGLFLAADGTVTA